MSPAKGRGVVDVASFCGLGDADTVDHGCGLCRPLVLHAQPGQRGFRQGIEGTLTGFATVAQQSARLAPMHDIAAGAMRATEAVHAALPKFSNNIASKPVQRLRQRRWRCDRRLVERYRRTAGGNVHAPRRTGLDVIATRSLGQGQRPPSLAPLRRRQCRDPAQPAVKLRHVHGGLLASQVSAIADTNNQRHESHKSRWQVELFFKWIKQHLRIKKFYGTSENAVKTQIWIAVSVYVLVAIVRKRLNLEASLYTILQVVSVSVFEKTPLRTAFS